jgi:hypothetical protein
MAKQLKCVNPLFTQLRRISSSSSTRNKLGLNGVFGSEEDVNNPIFADNNWSELSRHFPASRTDFPLPGQVGIVFDVQKPKPKQQQKATNNNKQLTPLKSAEKKLAMDNLNQLLQSPDQQRIFKLKEAILGHTFRDEVERALLRNENSKLRNELELKAYLCPTTILQDFQIYFRRKELGNKQLTIVTMSFKTDNDMATWSSEVESERENLMKKFVGTAQALCTVLESLGYWADYVDPSSGRPNKSEYAYATFFETDERYRQLGFDIEDHGCCKVINHHKWGSKAYVGALLTDAPLTGSTIVKMTDVFNGGGI